MTNNGKAVARTTRRKSPVKAVPNPLVAKPKRLRLTQIVVALHTVWDDGENLSPGPETNPIVIPAAEIEEWAQRVGLDVEEFGVTWLADNTVPEGKG